MFNTVYKTINTQNGKIYQGVHVTSDLDDGYLGSGKVITKAIEKYGVESFSKEILFMARSEPIAYWIENMLVDEEFVQRQDTYNLKVGGEGGFGFINSKMSKEERLRRAKRGRQVANSKGAHKLGAMVMKEKLKNTEFKEDFSKKVKEGLDRSGYSKGVFYGKTHSEETKKKIGKTNSVKQRGKQNSVFGKIWVHSIDLKKSKMIDKDEFPEYEKSGWLKGRKMKF